MIRRNKKSDKRKKAEQRLRDRQKRRAVKIIDDDKQTIITQPDGRGYDVEMIRDFLDQLLLEIRVQHFENTKALQQFKKTGSRHKAKAAAFETSDSLCEEFAKYQEKYQSALIAVNAIDGENASEEEIAEVSRGMLEANMKRRDEQIGHMEALEELFDEAIQCAKLPFGLRKDGHPTQPLRIYRVREIQDGILGPPNYDDLEPPYGEDSVITDDVKKGLKAANIIIAQIIPSGRQLMIYGQAEYERLKSIGSDEKATVITVEEPNYLKLLVATVHELKGRHDYRGNYFDEF